MRRASAYPALRLARGTDNRWSDVDLLVVMDEVEDKRSAAVEMSRALDDLTVS